MNLVVQVKGFSIRLMAYETVIIEGEMRLTDHDRVEWVTVEEMKEHQLAPADVPLVSIINIRVSHVGEPVFIM